MKRRQAETRHSRYYADVPPSDFQRILAEARSTELPQGDSNPLLQRIGGVYSIKHGVDVPMAVPILEWEMILRGDIGGIAYDQATGQIVAEGVRYRVLGFDVFKRVYVVMRGQS